MEGRLYLFVAIDRTSKFAFTDPKGESWSVADIKGMLKRGSILGLLPLK